MYEWDEAKRRSNRAKHRLDLTAIESFEWVTASTKPDNRHGEPRFVATGYIGSRLHIVVYTERGDRFRIISLRKSNKREEKDYVQRRGQR